MAQETVCVSKTKQRHDKRVFVFIFVFALLTVPFYCVIDHLELKCRSTIVGIVFDWGCFMIEIFLVGQEIECYSLIIIGY